MKEVFYRIIVFDILEGEAMEVEKEMPFVGTGKENKD